jgi:ADP-ribose pyrophosphatase YjhB (NUDIX family)
MGAHLEEDMNAERKHPAMSRLPERIPKMKQKILRAARGGAKIYWRIRQPMTVGVRTFVFNEKGAVLLVRHTYMDGWFLPGGGVHKGEPLARAALREAEEEVGVTSPRQPILFGAYSYFGDHKSDHIVLYEIKDWSMAPAPNLEIAEFGFFQVSELPKDTSPGTRRRLREYDDGGPTSELW